MEGIEGAGFGTLSPHPVSFLGSIFSSPRRGVRGGVLVENDFSSPYIMDSLIIALCIVSGCAVRDAWVNAP